MKCQYAAVVEDLNIQKEKTSICKSKKSRQHKENTQKGVEKRNSRSNRLACFACKPKRQKGQDNLALMKKHERRVLRSLERRMVVLNMLKTAAAGMLGFAVGAGAMMMPGNQKWKRQAQRQMDRIMRIAKSW